ncbi:hypothetical protein JI435_416820 [Parastagonospora nodorum SN15]|uniref:Uncharacterized protein n=1 Tax=Phaeosphaeria nodorum (strain SN15 / ATCC MYA-4574 / FGSC 10173) TaxID=321614 RepID=A0A7U2I325_PHANO|nr:hypothetical protein HBI09_125180 [Parastagonospora nodorum]KAH6473052.1 hypothetical protein HBI58_140860 [Parastagonospora nodorum]KAH6527471.1 hypothetical protein HBI81_116480 [Parastagonospora nodorum]QRD01506.1 hypothetical protein JI435_416820 [Parastagonospora nodorum SN15]
MILKCMAMERASPMFYIRDTRSDPSHDWRNAEPSSRKSKHDMLHLQNATVPNLYARAHDSCITTARTRPVCHADVMPTSRTSALRTPRRGSAPLGRQFERARAIDSPSASTREVASELWGQAIHLIAHPCAVGLGRVYIQE